MPNGKSLSYHMHSAPAELQGRALDVELGSWDGLDS